MNSIRILKIKPFLELLIILVSVIIIPWFVKTLCSIFHIANTLTQVILVFVIVSIASHAILYIRRNMNTQKLIKSLDYIYLGVAAFGLLGVAEITKNRLQHQYNEATTTATLNIIGLMEHEQELIDHYCKVLIDKTNRCEAHKSLYKSAKDELAYLPTNNRLSEVSKAIQRLKAIVDSSPEMDNVDKNYYKIISEIVDYSDTNNPNPDSQFLPDVDREQGYLYVASALALRIARVTVEVFRWYI